MYVWFMCYLIFSAVLFYTFLLGISGWSMCLMLNLGLLAAAESSVVPPDTTSVQGIISPSNLLAYHVPSQTTTRSPPGKKEALIILNYNINCSSILYMWCK